MMLRAAGIALICAVCAAVVKSLKGDYAPMVILGGLVILFAAAVPGIKSVSAFAQSIGESAKLGEYLTPVLKSIGIAYIAEFACDICRESGAAPLTSQISAVAKIEILLLGLPLVTDIVAYALALV